VARSWLAEYRSRIDGVDRVLVERARRLGA
jgi:hypothetical protein